MSVMIPHRTIHAIHDEIQGLFTYSYLHFFDPLNSLTSGTIGFVPLPRARVVKPLVLERVRGGNFLWRGMHSNEYL